MVIYVPNETSLITILLIAPGTILPYLEKDFGLTYLTVSLLFVASAFGYASADRSILHTRTSTFALIDSSWGHSSTRL